MSLTLQAGQRYDQFEVLDVLRRHDTCWVYRVRAPGHERPVALKLSLDPVSEEAARRALREIAVLGELTNAHVVDVYDSGLGSGDHWYIVMEDLVGAQLDRWHDFDQPLHAADAVRFIHQACLGLAEIHAQGIVHRDLKPDALWVEPDRNLKILDFGSARAWGGVSGAADNVTTHQVLVGSPPYVAPEQTFGAELKPAADVYSLGVILYELMSGHSPFFADRSRNRIHQDLRENALEWITAHVRVPPVALRSHQACADLPEKLVGLIHSALSKNPSDRPRDAGELANELGWILHHHLGAATGATLRVTDPDGVLSYRLVLPGSHRIGLGPKCAIRLAGGDGGEPLALLEWAGSPKPAELRPLGGQQISIDDVAIEARGPLSAGQQANIAGYRIELKYPD